MISFQKNLQSIKRAWEDVLDEESMTNWSLFEYEGQSNELKVSATGSGGLEELTDELNSGKIMYAFIKIEDPKTAVKKTLLVNWQGEGAPVLRKGMCANHIHDVAKLLSGAHLTISARNEDDIELERLLKKLNTVVSSGYRSMKEEPPRTEFVEKQTVGTNYKRIIPTKELNPSIMQDFWRKEEEEEKKRIAVENATKKEQILKLEQEQRAREEKEHQAREGQLIGVTKLQSAYVPIKTTPQPLDTTVGTDNNSSGSTKAEEMRQMRNREARELIGSRVGTAKAIFTQNTSQGQLQAKLNSAPPSKPARSSITHRIHAFDTGKFDNQSKPHQSDERQDASCTETVNKDKINANPNTEEMAHKEETQFNDDYLTILDSGDNYSTIKRSPHSKTNSLQSPDDYVALNASDAANQGKGNDQDHDEVMRTKVSVTVQQPQSVKNGVANTVEKNLLSDIVNEDELICQDGLGELGLKAKALYDYQAADESEITFDPGDIITHIDQIDEGWWQGLAPDGTYGLFPANYVEIVN